MYKGYRVSISKENDKINYQSVNVNTREYSFNPNQMYSPYESNFNSSNESGIINSQSTKMVILNEAKKAINYGLNSYGDLTGDYITQDNLQDAVELGQLMIMASSGPIGAVAATSALAYKMVSQEINLIKKNQEVKFFNERTGSSFYSGGR